jgi:hypothetical protein
MLWTQFRRPVLWIVVPTALLVLLYAAVGFFAIPRLIHSSLQTFVAQHYGRKLSLGEVRFNPFTLKLEMRDFALPDADSQPMLAFRRLLVDLNISTLWRGPSFGSIELEQPFARALIKEDGKLNFADLAQALASGKTAPGAQPARVFIDRLSVLGGHANFEDRTHPTPFRSELQPITFELRDFSTTGKTGNSYTLTGASTQGERFNWAGTFGLTPLASRGRFEVANLQARTIWSYLRDSVHFELPSGIIEFAGDYDFTTGGTPIGLTVNVHNLAITDLGVRPKGATANYIDLARVELHDARADVGKQTVDVRNVRLAGGEVRAWLEPKGAVNLLELVGPAETATPLPAESAPHEAHAQKRTPWSLAVHDIAVEALKVSSEDRQVTPTVALTLDALNAHVANFSTARDSHLTVAFDSTINGSGKVDIQADIAPDLTATSARAELARLDLTAFQPYISQRTAMTLLSGLLTTKLRIERGSDGNVAVKGDAEVAQLRTVDNALKQDFIKFERLQARDIDYRSNPGSLRIHAIVARAPYARVIVEADQSVNVKKVLSSSRPPNEAAVGTETTTAATIPIKHTPARPTQSERAIPISIDIVRIQNGSANYADFWIQPNFAVGIQGLNGSIIGLSSNPRARAKVELQGKVDRYAPVHIWGDINPLAATAYSDIKMSFRGVDLTSVTPYSGRFAGYKIEKGKVSIDLRYKVAERRLTAEHRFVIDQLQLGERVESPDAVKLPVRMAVALLKDRHGVIDINLPVTGSLDDPQFRIGPLIWKAALGLLTKVATAPFALLGRLFGGSEEMNFIDFQPGSANLETPAKEKLATLAKALKEKPQLELDVPVTFSAALDRSQLAAQQLQAKLLALKGQEPAARKRRSTAPPDESILADPAEHFRLLVLQYRAEIGKDAALPATAQAIEATKKKKAPAPAYDPAIAELQGALVARISVADADLEALGKQRAQAIQDTLLASGDIDPARVFIIGSAPKETTDKVRVELSLK